MCVSLIYAKCPATLVAKHLFYYLSFLSAHSFPLLLLLSEGGEGTKLQTDMVCWRVIVMFQTNTVPLHRARHAQ